MPAIEERGGLTERSHVEMTAVVPAVALATHQAGPLEHAQVLAHGRAKTWPEGLYSIVRFELVPDGAGTKLVFDHDGFPQEMADHLSKGWHANYWENIAKRVS